MKRLLFLLGCLQLLGAAAASYKQWLPNTNFETAANWEAGRVPCAGDAVHFEPDKVVSVFVKSQHAVKDMYLPLSGEFILAAGAGFAAFDGSWEPGCDSGSAARFRDAEGLSWFDPALWQPLRQDGRIFAVDEERVPCHYDDVIFAPETSFRVNVDSSRGVIHLRSLSLMGQTFASTAALAQYLQGPSGPLQFHGNSTFQVMGTACPDKSGCVCGNTQDGPRICAGRRCPELACRSPLRPLGHCCGVCGAMVCLEFTPSFDLQQYRDRLIQTFLSLPQYAGVQMAISKVHKAQSLLGATLRSSAPVIQIVLIEEQNGSATSPAAELVAADIMGDIAQHGEALGISSGRMEVSSGAGSVSSGQTGVSASRRVLTGTVLGLLCALLLLGGMLFLYRKGTLRLRAVRIPRPWGRAQGPAPPESATIKGFDNPIFDVPAEPMEPPGAAPGEDMQQAAVFTDTRLFYLNPLYDAQEAEA
ncbi:protein amnionless [Eudromia elegans]